MDDELLKNTDGILIDDWDAEMEKTQKELLNNKNKK